MAQEMILKKKKRSYTDDKQDIHEKDRDYLIKVAKAYQNLSDHPNWSRITCNVGQQMRNPNKILNDILKALPL